MSFAAVKEVQVGVVSTLLADSILMGRGLTGVFDEAPTDQAYPYISIGTKVQTPWKEFQRQGYEVTLVLDIWTSLDGGDVHFDILDDVARLFDDKPLPLASFASTQCVLEWTITLIDEDMTARHTIARLRTINS